MQDQPQTAVMVKMATELWDSEIASFDNLLESLTDIELEREIAPGKNRVVYLAGHMAAVHDAMLPLLGFGELLHPELQPIYIRTPDRAVVETPSAADLRKYWKEINQKIQEGIQKTAPEAWFGRHNSISEEDFAKEPHRNKLNLLIGRAKHVSYHLGQLVLVCPGNAE